MVCDDGDPREFLARFNRPSPESQLVDAVLHKLIEVGIMLDNLPHEYRQRVVPIMLLMAERASRPLKVDVKPKPEISTEEREALQRLAMDCD